MDYIKIDMKKILFIFSLFTTISFFAQKQEVKVDLLDILALRSLDVSYERILNDEASFGLSVFVNFESESNDFRYNEDFQIVPYFRQNFSKVGSFDFFGEVFGSLNFGDTDEKKVNDVVTKKSENYTDFALGLGAGLKHVSTNGYIFEVHAGVGRNLFDADTSPSVVPRFGINIGKQF